MHIVPKDDLFQIEEGPLMRHPLADLNDSCPCMRRERALAVVTLTPLDHEFNNTVLLHHRRGSNLLLEL